MVKFKYLLLFGIFISSANTWASFLSDDDFFSHPNTQRAFRIYEDDGLLKVRMTGTQTIEQGAEQGVNKRSKILDAIIGPKTWEHDDGNLCSYQGVLCKVFIDGIDDIISVGAYRREQQFPYLEGDHTEERENVSLTSWGTVYDYITYQRPDETTYKKKGNPLFQTRTVEEEKLINGNFRVCVREWDEFCIQGFKSKTKRRHQINVYNLFENYQVIWARDMDGRRERILEENFIKETRKIKESGEDGRCGDVRE